MDAYSRQGRYLIPDGVLALTFIAVELQLCDIATGIIWTDITNIAKAASDRHICIVHLFGSTGLRNEIEGNSIEEVGTVTALEETELDACCLTRARTPAHLSYYMSRT